MKSVVQKIVVLLLLAGTAAWMSPGRAVMPTIPIDQSAGMQFIMMDVLIDSGKIPLGAYQIDITLPDNVKIVGLEGGDPAPFHDAPYYDPAALVGNRIVIAAFSTSAVLPSGRTCVARLHLQVNGDAASLAAIAGTLTVATDSEGQSIQAGVFISPSPPQGERP